MQNTSALYKQILSTDHYFETSVVIGDGGDLITEDGDRVVFGVSSSSAAGETEALCIQVAGTAPEEGYREDELISVSTDHAVFANGVPEIGSVISGEVDIVMLKPVATLPRMAKIAVYYRAISSADTSVVSEWLKKGIYYIDTREFTDNDNGADTMTIHGYDAILKTEMDYPDWDTTIETELSYPITDVQCIQHIAKHMGVDVDAYTISAMTKGYTVSLPVGYSSREILGIIASWYGGNFIMSDDGELKLIIFGKIPANEAVLCDSAGYRLTFGTDDDEVGIYVYGQ